MPGGEEQPVKKEESKERLVGSEKTRNKKLVDSIIEFDEATWHWIIQSDKAMEHLSKVMDLGKYSAYQIYQVAEEVKEYQYSASTAFTSRSAPNKEWGELANEYLRIFSMREPSEFLPANRLAVNRKQCGNIVSRQYCRPKTYSAL